MIIHPVLLLLLSMSTLTITSLRALCKTRLAAIPLGAGAVRAPRTGARGLQTTRRACRMRELLRAASSRTNYT